MKTEKQSEIVMLALGEASALFMSQGDTPAGEIIMPSEELIRIAKETVDKLNS